MRKKQHTYGDKLIKGLFFLPSANQAPNVDYSTAENSSPKMHHFLPFE